MASSAVSKLLQLTPATADEVEKFISENRRWIDDSVATELRGMSGLDQRRVVSGGTIVSCRDASGVIRSRVRQAKEKEALLAGIHASQTTDTTTSNPGEDRLAVVVQDGTGKLSRPATQEEVDAFVASNKRWLGEEAEEILRVMSSVDQKRVIAAGTMSGCRDPVAVVQTRAKKARDMEVEFEQLTKGKQEKVNQPSVPVPTFSADVGAAYIFAKPQEVRSAESRFAPPPARSSEEAGNQPGELVGEVRGVGGVVEILRAKYGCSRGQRMKVVGETNGLLQFDGGKTVPKNHEGSGYRWVLQSDNEPAKPPQAAATEAPKQPRREEEESKAREPKVALEGKAKETEKAKSKRRSSKSPPRAKAKEEESKAREPKVALEGKAKETKKAKSKRRSSKSPPRAKAKEESQTHDKEKEKSKRRSSKSPPRVKDKDKKKRQDGS